jgi:hypothetical protein
VQVTLTVFRTLDPPSHDWPHQSGYEVLLRRTFGLTYAAGKVDQLR